MSSQVTADLRSVRVADIASLRALRGLVDLDEVVIDTARLKHRGLLPLTFRWALWAVRPGGRIDILDDGVMDQEGEPLGAPFNKVRAWAMRFLGRDADLTDFEHSGRMVFTRRTTVMAPGWSAGVIVSGSEAELPQLRACLDALRAQPELAPENGGEIVVCGPPGAAPAFIEAVGARYLPFEAPAGARFLIGEKKNALAAALRGPRMIILHVRIVLEPGALAAVPREFDIVSPNTYVQRGGRLVPYLSLTAIDPPLPGVTPRRLGLSLRNVPSADPLKLHEAGFVFVDGGAFITTRALYDRCPLDPALAWEEGEDVDWCLRAFVAGHVSELAPNCRAVSQTSKLRDRAHLGPLERAAEKLYRGARLYRARLRDRVLRITGRR